MTTYQEQTLQHTIKLLKGISPKAVETVLNLLQEGNTVPFIARYRKEMTGALDEVAIREIDETYQLQAALMKRKDDVLRLIDEQEKLTIDIKEAIDRAEKMQQLEDIYRPFKQKKRTKATIAKEKGLTPLAQFLMNGSMEDVEAFAETFINAEKEVLSVEEALQGAHEIMAEMISDEPKYREWIRRFANQHAVVESSVKNADKDEKGVYSHYYEFAQPLKLMKPHQTLAMNRGEKEDVLKVAITLPGEKVMAYFAKQLIKKETLTSEYVAKAYEDSYKRFIFPSIEREIRSELTELADTQAIHVFAENLKNLLLQPPMKEKVVLGLDPAYRTGCKLAIVDATGRVLDKGVIYPHKPANAKQREEASVKFKRLIEKYDVRMVAIGNGTASRESEIFVAENIKQLKQTVHYVIVNEAGASVYSASDVARAEFPDFQVEERSAVSIARRLQDPLAELIKIDPKSVGVGQYQHDVSQKQLEVQLDAVVEDVVNAVGVNLNTASSALLQRVSGLNKTIATNIVAYRDEHGTFNNRQELKKVPRLGPKAFEQAVGFLRVSGGDNVLDNTAIHPEVYVQTKELLCVMGVTAESLGQADVQDKIKAMSVERAVELTGLGKETIKDILEALEKPGRDVRDAIAAPLLRSDVLSMEDLTVGMKLQGTVRNVVDFGAFVDIGVKQDGLVHLSKMSERFVKRASDVVSVGDIVTVWIDQVDVTKNRISLTMVGPNE
ncbi:RNA-binding transcriptional accessory protein [Carnobacteriaceae bacterium zg-ZUI240]|nr:RNA-binding transcriptional accessory protein [Carnobacteriaceae bacterium zg-ZUI240]